MTAAKASTTLSTHVLDTALGKPASGVRVTLEHVDERGTASALGSGTTDADGRLRQFGDAPRELTEGTYRLRFDVAAYFATSSRETLFPEITILFRVTGGVGHYHVPLLVSPYAYTTYRGS